MHAPGSDRHKAQQVSCCPYDALVRALTRPAFLVQAVKAASADQEGQQAAKKHVEGLDQALNLTQAARQANVLDRSRTDWDQFKSADQHVDEELEAYKRSGAKYLDRQDFMQRTELRQYEKDRDQRLGTTRTPQS